MSGQAPGGVFGYVRKPPVCRVDPRRHVEREQMLYMARLHHIAEKPPWPMPWLCFLISSIPFSRRCRQDRI